MKFQIKLLTICVIALASFSFCKNEDKDNNQTTLVLALLEANRRAEEAAKECLVEVDNNKTFDISSPLELCKPSAGSGRHFRFEEVATTTNNGYLNLLIGYGQRNDSTNFPTTTGFGGSAATTNTGDGRWRVFFGKSQSCDKALVDIRFSGINTGISGGNGFYTELFTTQALTTPSPSGPNCSAQSSGIWGPSTICMDIAKDGRITIWASGQKGADCKNLSTLKQDNAVYEKKDWNTQTQTKDDRNYIYRNLDGISVKRIVVRSETVIK